MAREWSPIGEPYTGLILHLPLTGVAALPSSTNGAHSGYSDFLYMGNLIVRRECWGTDSNSNIVYQMFYKYEHLSRWAVFWNCPKPYILEVYRISLDTSTAKFVGFFWCEWDYCIPTSIAKKYNVFFYSTKSFSKGVTPIILRQIDSCIVHNRPYSDTL